MWVPGLHPRPPESDILGVGQGLWVERDVPACYTNLRSNFYVHSSLKNTGLDLALVTHKQTIAEIIYGMYYAVLNFLNGEEYINF